MAWSILIIALGWLVMALVYWFHPGGPAWGKYRFKKCATLSVSNKPIPGPRGLPLIGSMNLMASSLADHKIEAAAETCKAKRLMAFSLGDTRVIVTCNPDVAREILSSSVFSDCPVIESAYSLMFNRAIGFAPYRVYWRTLRRIAATHLFSPKQIKGSEEQRRLIASEMVTLFANHHSRMRMLPSVHFESKVPMLPFVLLESKVRMLPSIHFESKVPMLPFVLLESKVPMLPFVHFESKVLMLPFVLLIHLHLFLLHPLIQGS
ncbi:Cytochrome P450 78A3 [Hibiscus syriacus]|uniref:Cytochrome P450 78A3 n=1 Tax=Hibiscus syriacus TaxID=106335 RepID=A0A6A3A9A9_HIBSY|nr:Cytochrome P450 78A3 [Hibiscus syriacus]